MASFGVTDLDDGVRAGVDVLCTAPPAAARSLPNALRLDPALPGTLPGWPPGTGLLSLPVARLCPGLETPLRPDGGRDRDCVGAPAGLLGGCCCWDKGEVTCGGRALLL